jgi:hypothetical protein
MPTSEKPLEWKGKEVAEMKTQLVEGVEVHRGSGNVFADLGLAGC